MEKTLVPSLPAKSFEELLKLSEAMVGVSGGIQVDIVDGVFVPFKSWPFTEATVEDQWGKLSEIVGKLEVEVDCMVTAPEQYIPALVNLGVKRIIIHIGSTDRYSELVKHAKSNGYKIGFAFTNDVPLSFIYPYIGKIDFVQIMGIKKVGQQGQPFDERTIETAKNLRAQYPDLEIAVDGSVNEETMPRLLAAGVTRFAPGSAISNSPDPKTAYKQLESLIKK